MMTSQTPLFFMGLLLIAVLIEPLIERSRVPFSIVLILLGYSGSEFVTKFLGIDTGIRWYNFHFIVFHIFLPILIFHSALKLNVSAVRKDIVPIFFLAIPFMLIGTFITGAILYFGIGHPTGFPWEIALVAGALLSATDPSAVVGLLNKAEVPERLNTLLEGESLFNDATAVVLFSLFIAMALHGNSDMGWRDGMNHFVMAFFGGLLIGLILGFVAYLIFKYYTRPFIHGLISILCAYSAYILAEDVFHFSGVMAVLAAGLIAARGLSIKDESCRTFSNNLWRFGAYISDKLVFILAGITITLDMFINQWLAMLIGIIAVLTTRAVVVFLLLGPICHLPGINTIPFKHQLILNWGGVRGTVTMALALSLPLMLDAWYTVQSIAYGVVIFTLFMQTTTMNYLIRKLKVSETTEI